MYNQAQFRDHLQEEYGEDIFTERILPQMKKYVKASLQTVQD